MCPLSDGVVNLAIVDGDPLFRQGLRRILENTRYRVEVIAPSIGEVLGRRSRLDLMLLLGFPSDDPLFLDAVAELRGSRPKVRVVAIAENRADQLVVALKAGIHGYLPSQISAEALLRFLSLIVLGQRVFSMRSLALPDRLHTATPGEDVIRRFQDRIESSAFTSRERALLVSLVGGQSNKVIARRLGLAETTVKALMAKLFDKIGAANRTQAAVLAWRSGLQAG
jgi:DNA-binding NarL/FixJ family response regulator